MRMCILALGNGIFLSRWLDLDKGLTQGLTKRNMLKYNIENSENTSFSNPSQILANIFSLQK